MKFIPILLVGLVLSIPNQSHSQKKKANEEDILLANKLKTEHEDEDFVSLSIKEKYSFALNAKEGKVEATLVKDEELLSLKEISSWYRGLIFFDEQSKVSFLRGYNFKGKPEPLYETVGKYKTAGIFYDDAQTVTFTLDFNRIGDKQRYKYAKNFFDVRYFTKCYFHSYYNILNKEIIFEIPEWLEIDIKEINFEGFDVQKSEMMEGSTRVIKYSMNDLPPIRNKKLASNYSQSLPHLLIVPISFLNKDEKVTIFEKTKDLYNWYASLVDQVDNDPSVIKEKVNDLLKNVGTDKEKIENIFYWVQDNIRYVAFEDGIMGFKPATAQDVFLKKYGDCKGMANLTSEMLKLAGFDARLTWIGTRSIPYDYDIPCLAVDNHMITTVYLNGKAYFLDATEKGKAFGEYAYRIQGQDVLIQDGENFIIDTVPEFDHSYNKIFESYEMNLDENLNLKGKGFKKLFGDEKSNFYSSIAYLSKDEVEDKVSEYLSNSDKNIKVTNLDFELSEDRKENIEFNFNVEFSNQFVELENEAYLNAEFDKDFIHLEIPEERINDLDFKQKVHIAREYNLKYPSKFKVDYTPEKVDIDNDDFRILLEYDQGQGTLNYNKVVVVKSGIVKAKNIDAWNEALSKMKEFYNDQVLFKY